MSDRHEDVRELTTPLSDQDALSVRCGDRILLSGVAYAARDSAHRLLLEALEGGGRLPFDPAGQVIYYVGPSPARPGRAVGAAGPTTSYRMDRYAPALYRAGVKATIGKGPRSEEVRRCLRQCRALYLAAIGGAGALLGRYVVESEVVAFPQLGPGAVRRLVLDRFPVVVADDAYGGDIYKMALEQDGSRQR